MAASFKVGKVPCGPKCTTAQTDFADPPTQGVGGWSSVGCKGNPPYEVSVPANLSRLLRV